MNTKTLVVLKENYPQNHPCSSVSICPAGSLKQTGFDAPAVELDTCIRCGKCTDFCPQNALVLV
jgi:ferredoxin